ncbi:replicative DNA helicase [Planctomycetota bacterium]
MSEPELQRLPPQSEEAERAVLGSMMLDRGCIPTVRRWVAATDFHLPDHAAIFTAILELDEEGTDADLVSLAEALKAHGELESVGGPAFLIGLLDGTPSAANAEYYAVTVANRSARRALIHAANEAARGAYDLSVPVTESITALRLALDGVRTEESARASDLAEIVERIRSTLYDDGDGRWRWQTGIPLIDTYFRGIGVGRQWVIGGRSGMYKTGLACGILRGTLEGGHRACMFRYEESEESIVARLAGQLSNVPCGRINAGEAGDDELAAYDAALTRIAAEWNEQFCVRMNPTLGEIEAVVADLKPALVIYDTVQAMADQLGGTEGKRRDLDVQGMCQFAARLCARPTNEHASIIISQLQKGSGRPSMDQLRETGAIEESTDVAVLLWWPHKEKDSCSRDRLVVRVGKNRITCRLATLATELDPDTQRLGNLLNAGEAEGFLLTT